ncbi:dihydroorotate oxidase [Colletotrichum tofieldiae]|nr:dihydroorotate oxidase [Colletotrichum tofieldiae]
MPTPTLFRVFLRRQTPGLRSRISQHQQRRANSDAPKQKRAEDPIPVPNTVSTIPLWQRLGPLTRAAEGYARAQRKRPLTTHGTLLRGVACYVGVVVVVLLLLLLLLLLFLLLVVAVVGHSSLIELVFHRFIFLSQNFNYASRLLSLGTKVVVNQVCFTPIFNSYFFGMQAFLAGDNFEQIIERIRRTVPVSIVNSCKLWPAVTAFSFSFIPMEYRSVFSGVIAVGWQTYLSFLNRQAEVVEEVEERTHAMQAVATRERSAKMEA